MQKHFEPILLAYLAGLFDGEGSIFIAVNKPKHGKSPQHFLGVTIGNTYLPLIDWLKDTFGGSVTSNNSIKKRHKPLKNWRLASNQAKNFLVLIYPYLQIKKEQARLATEFQSEPQRLPRNNPDYFGLSQEIIDKRDWYKKQISEANGLNARFKPTKIQ